MSSFELPTALATLSNHRVANRYFDGRSRRHLRSSQPGRGPGRTRIKANSSIHALPSPAMSTPPGWDPRPGPTRGGPARRAPHGSGGWAGDDAGPRRPGGRVGAPGPSFTPGRGPGPRDGGPGGTRTPRPGQGRPSNSDGADRRGPLPDDSAGRRPVERNRPMGGQNGADALRPEGVSRMLGRMSTRTAMLVLFAFTAVGVIFTLIAGQEPGGLLGFFIIVGTIAAALGIRRGKVYLLFPAPALAFFVAAIIPGKVHDAKLGSSTAGLGAGFTQWVAGMFFPAVVATII